jgi:glucuronate isomerase
MTTATSHTKKLSFRIEPDFLLYNKTAGRLYHEVAKNLPIIDPHNHVDASALAANRKFENLYQLWIGPDAYKHRIMRNLGVAEKLVAGDATDLDKFMAWAECFPQTVGNPMFHWSCMELQALFGFEEMLSPDNAAELWQTANGSLQQDGYGALDLMRRFGVEMLCTSDDLLDNLEHHISLSNQQQELACLPSLRGDTIITFAQPQFGEWLKKLRSLTGMEVTNLSSYKQAVIDRIEFFDRVGCLLSDHSFDSGFRFLPTGEETAAALFERVINEGSLNADESIQLQSHLMHFLGKEYAKRDWKMQLHIGAQRYTSSRIRKVAGPAGGFACIGNGVDVTSLCMLLDSLDVEENLPKTILYTLNPADNPVFATLTGSFAEDGVKGKVQFGPAWWFNDHHEGITQQLITLANYGLLSTSIGMTTDSRSVLSFLRHDYYRRILCNLVGSWAEEKKVPDDWEALSNLVANIAYFNCKNWIKKVA